jgi:hypothetical protein
MPTFDLEGAWESEYTYGHDQVGGPFTDTHIVDLMDVSGAGSFSGHSRPKEADDSLLILDLEQEEGTLSGAWHEATSHEGVYGGALFCGVLHLILAEDGNSAEGMWLGHNRDKTAVKSGEWVLRRLQDS